MIGQVIGGRYSLDREIGRGGMGAVWLGRDEVLGRTVAVKVVGVMPGGSSPDVLRAEREARIAASLNHPNIVGIYDLVVQADHRYLVMEYVEGRTLAALIRERGPIPARQAARILGQVAAALGAAHASSVVHRDVKPSNILVRDDGHVKLSDFGIARTEADVSLTMTGMVTGSPAYLAPEVATGRPATPASDVWSLGATLFHALAGRPPYAVGDNVLGALYRIVNEPPPRLPDAGELTPVLLATMAQEPAGRWTMPEVARVLDLVAAVPVATSGAAPVSLPELPEVSEAPATDVEGSTRTSPEVAALPPRRSRRPVLPLLVAVVVVALVAVIAALATMDDPQSSPSGTTTSTTDGPSAGSTPPATADTEPSAPTTTPVTARALETFVTDYLSVADADPVAGFAMLTTGFQRASGGFAGYEGFWGKVSGVEVLSVAADPGRLTVTYTYRYRYGGDDMRTDNVSLTLRRSGDGFLIAGEV